MARKIVVTSGKGGVGKTTVVVNLAIALSLKGERVVVCDADFGLNNADVVAGVENLVVYDIVDVIEGRCRASQALVRHPDYPNLYLLASRSAPERYISPQAFKLVLDGFATKYDFILIDCPPSLNILTINAFRAADSILVPIQCEFYALEGLTQLISTINLVKQRLNPRIDIEGILFTMYDNRTKLCTQVVDEVKGFLPSKIYETKIPRNIRLAEAPSYGMPVIYYERSSKGGVSYSELADEVISKNQ
jgi:chromosome partitioning protein